MIITDEMLIAYLGDKLSDVEREAVEAAVEADPSVADRLRRHREVGAMIQDAISAGGRKNGKVPSGKPQGGPAPVVSLADARKTRETPPPQARAPRPPKVRKPLDPRWGALIVGAILGLIGGYMIPRPTAQLVDSDQFARAELDKALESRLSTEQDADAPVRILATYQPQAGVWCRIFDSKSHLSGIACRSKDGWRVFLTEFGVSQPSAAQVATIRSLKLGTPVSAAAEKKARATAWR